MKQMVKNIFGLQMKRTVDLIALQGREAFYKTGLLLDAKLISIVISLYENPEQTSSELARSTGLIRQLVESRLKKLENEKYVKSAVCQNDSRRRLFTLTDYKIEEVQKAVNIMKDFEIIYELLWKELEIDVSKTILKLEQALQAKPLLTRLCEHYPEYIQKIRS